MSLKYQIDIPNIDSDKENVLPNSFDKKEIYFCECDKKYMSFPALYVHARIKHNLKLSSSSKTQLWKTKETDKYIEKTFSLKYGIENSDHPFVFSRNNGQLNALNVSDRPVGPIEFETQSLLDVFDKFLKDFEEESLDQELIGSLFLFLSTKWGETVNKEIVGLIPYELNSYAIEKLPALLNTQVWSQKWNNGCQRLLKFGKWLYENNYTKLLVVYN